MLRVEAALADQAFKDSNSSLTATWLMRGIKPDGPVSVAHDSVANGRSETLHRDASDLPKIPGVSRDWSSALDLIREAEARANEAETWLVRIHDAVLNGFRRKPSAVFAPVEVGNQDLIEAQSAAEG
jgi:hypothetical protein